MIIIETERLILRRFQLSDDNAMNCVFGDAEVMRFGDGVKTEEEIGAWLVDCIEDYYQQRDFGPWAVVEKNSRSIIGYCGLFYFPDVNGMPEIEIGYRLARSFWGKGYATEAALAVRDYAFDTLGLTRLITMIDPQNVASIRVAEKIGMIYEQDVMFDGYTHPDHVYAIVQSMG